MFPSHDHGGGTSGGDPFLHFDIDSGAEYSIGMDNADSDKLKISTGADPGAGTRILQCVNAAGADHTYMWGQDLVGYTQNLAIVNQDNTNTSSHAKLSILSGSQGNGGDPHVLYTLSGGQSWTHGIDSSVGTSFTLSASNALGTSNVMTIDTSGNGVITGSWAVDNLKLDGNTLSSTNTNGNVNITPDGTGRIVLQRS